LENLIDNLPTLVAENTNLCATVEFADEWENNLNTMEIQRDT